MGRDYLVTINRLLTTRELADFLGVSESWCNQRRSDRDGPPYVKVGGAVRYQLDSVLTWVSEQEVVPSHGT